ncbi:MAG TPA: HAD family phosphatase [Bacteroidales bacterium]|nr:HAD family phosphatase [Bacteroidales bacterium]
MAMLSTVVPSRDKIRNIIFDFGGVICDLDIPRTEKKFNAFGPPREIPPVNEKETTAMWEDLVGKLETGEITPAGFRSAIRDHYPSSPSDAAIDEAWNALLTGMPMARIHLLESIRRNYRIFLLSNSNEIHYQHFLKAFQQQTGYKDFDGLFEKAYFSFQVHLRKPDPAIFRLVLEQNGLIPSETLFIDDTEEHVRAANGLGVLGYQLKEGQDITGLFG